MTPLQTKIAEILHENFDKIVSFYKEEETRIEYTVDDYEFLKKGEIPDSILSKAIEDIERLVEEEVYRKIESFYVKDYPKERTITSIEYMNGMYQNQIIGKILSTIKINHK